MKHIELVDVHRKDIAMTEQSGNLSQGKKARGWKALLPLGGFWSRFRQRLTAFFESLPKARGGGWREDVGPRNRWLYGALTLASFLTLQTLLPVGLKDIALTVSILAFAVVLPMSILLVLLTYTRKEPKEKVRVPVGVIAIAGTFIGIDAAFWHTSWVVGVVYSVVSVIAFAVGCYYLFFLGPKANEKG